MGVFATRSPFRPNAIGLSCVRLVSVEKTPHGMVLNVAGADLMNGTPILDVKPYLPIADCRPEALGGFAKEHEGHALAVEIPPHLADRVPSEKLAALKAVLAQDPRPAYQHDPERVYGFTFAGLEIKFTVSGGVLTVKNVI